MRRRQSKKTSALMRVDAVVGHQLFEVKRGVSALRSVRVSLMHLAGVLARHPGFDALLVLPDARVTRARLEEEWALAATVLRPELAKRISICVGYVGDE